MNFEKYLLSEESGDIAKGIFSQDGKKVMGTRTGKLTLGFIDSEGYIKDVDWKTFHASNLPWMASQKDDDNFVKKEYLNIVVNQEKQFNKKVDYNSWLRSNSNKSWEEKVDKAVSMFNLKISKTGLKRV